MKRPNYVAHVNDSVMVMAHPDGVSINHLRWGRPRWINMFRFGGTWRMRTNHGFTVRSKREAFDLMLSINMASHEVWGDLDVGDVDGEPGPS